MQIQINLDTQCDPDLLALKALVDMLSSGKVLVDRGTGPFKDFDPAKVDIYSSTEHGEMALQHVNLDENVGDVKLNTIAKVTVCGLTIPDVGDVVSADCGNSLNLKPAVDPAPSGFSAADEKRIREQAAEIASQELKKTRKKELSEPIVDVETADVNIKDASIDEALDQLDPKPPKDKTVDKIAELRRLMLKVVQNHGSEGAKIASQTINEIAGVRALAKIPDDKFEEVKKGLLAAVESKRQGSAAPGDPGVTPVDDVSRPTVSPDVDY